MRNCYFPTSYQIQHLERGTVSVLAPDQSIDLIRDRPFGWVLHINSKKSIFISAHFNILFSTKVKLPEACEIQLKKGMATTFRYRHARQRCFLLR